MTPFLQRSLGGLPNVLTELHKADRLDNLSYYMLTCMYNAFQADNGETQIAYCTNTSTAIPNTFAFFFQRYVI